MSTGENMQQRIERGVRELVSDLQMQVIILRAALDDANEKLAAYGQQKNSEPIKSGQEAETD